MFSSRGTVRYEQRGQGYRDVEKVGNHCSTCFGRPLRPSSGALQTVIAATGVCHELSWNKSCIDVKVGEHCTIPWPKCYSL